MDSVVLSDKKRIELLEVENEAQHRKIILLMGEINRVLETFDQAVDEVLNEAIATRLRLRISELNKPQDDEPKIQIVK